MSLSSDVDVPEDGFGVGVGIDFGSFLGEFRGIDGFPVGGVRE